MNLIALTRLAVKAECDLPRGLVCRHRRVDGEKAEAGQAGDRTLDAVGIADHLSQHLIAAADADDGASVAMSADDGLRTTVAAQFQQVVEGGFRTG